MAARGCNPRLPGRQPIRLTTRRPRKIKYLPFVLFQALITCMRRTRACAFASGKLPQRIFYKTFLASHSHEGLPARNGRPCPDRGVEPVESWGGLSKFIWTEGRNSAEHPGAVSCVHCQKNRTHRTKRTGQSFAWSDRTWLSTIRKVRCTAYTSHVKSTVTVPFIPYPLQYGSDQANY